MRVLLQARADPNLPVRQLTRPDGRRRRRVDEIADEIAGSRPLHLACAVGSASCVRTLLLARADPMLPDDYGVSPLLRSDGAVWSSNRQ